MTKLNDVIERHEAAIREHERACLAVDLARPSAQEAQARLTLAADEVRSSRTGLLATMRREIAP